MTTDDQRFFLAEPGCGHDGGQSGWRQAGSAVPGVRNDLGYRCISVRRARVINPGNNGVHDLAR
jgi:hypothetical protein